METDEAGLHGVGKIVSRESCGYVSQDMWFCDFAKLIKKCKFAPSEGRSKARKLSASGGFASLTPHQGLCPWTPMGALTPRASHVFGVQPPN